MTKISLAEILTLLIATVILLLALFSATFDSGELINFKFGKFISRAPFLTMNAYVDTVSIDDNTIAFEQNTLIV